MTNNQADTLERIERFGISRTAWRLIVMAAFAMLAFLGAFLSLTKGSADISLAQIINILSNPTLEPQSQIIWNIRMPRTIVGALVPLCEAGNSTCLPLDIKGVGSAFTCMENFEQQRSGVVAISGWRV